jgi:hypothetical protein
MPADVVYLRVIFVGGCRKGLLGCLATFSANRTRKLSTRHGFTLLGAIP